MVIFPSPAGGSIKPAAAGVQALTMNSPGSAWTPVLAGLDNSYAGEGKIRSLNRRAILSIELVQNIGQVNPITLPFCINKKRRRKTFKEFRPFFERTPTIEG